MTKDEELVQLLELERGPASLGTDDGLFRDGLLSRGGGGSDEGEEEEGEAHAIDLTR